MLLFFLVILLDFNSGPARFGFNAEQLTAKETTHSRDNNNVWKIEQDPFPSRQFILLGKISSNIYKKYTKRKEKRKKVESKVENKV